MQGSSDVIEVLNRVLENVHSLHEEAHAQEHLYELRGWAFSKWFDDVEGKAHDKLLHFLINRVGALGGKPSVWQWAWTSDPTEEIGDAMTTMLASLQKVRNAYGDAYAAAEQDQDYVTGKMLWKHMKRLEKWMLKFEGRLAEYNRLGPVAFMAEYV